MLEKLKILVEKTNPRVLGQVLKSSNYIELYDWVERETINLPDASIKEKVWYLLNNKPNFICNNGNKKTFNPKKLQYGFCDNIKNCLCFQQHAKENYKPRDMSIVIEKRKDTWLKKYGVDNASKAEGVKSKRRETMSKKDYSSIFNQLAQEKETLGFNQVIQRVSETVTPCFSREEYHGSNRKNKYLWKCNGCQHQFESHVDYGTVPKCSICYPKTVSRAESEIATFIRTLGENIITNDKSILSGKELDIYIPDKNIAIEYNGIYWHSSIKKTPNYHVNKMLECKKQNIQLIHIFEDEWQTKPEIVKNRLRSILGHDDRVAARKCNIIALTFEEYKNFVEKTHIRGYAHSTIKYGLALDGKIKAVMGFSKSRYTKTGYELIRYCSDGTVVGGAGKLLKHFIKKHRPECIVTYADRCWSNGNLYKKLGFTDITSSEANTGYWYIKNGIRYHRSNFTKARLIKLGYDPNKNESAIMQELGYTKIHDCGNYKFILNP